jgi:hypothetical protein
MIGKKRDAAANVGASPIPIGKIGGIYHESKTFRKAHVRKM